MEKLNNVMSQAGSYQGLRKRAEQEKPRGSASLNEEVPSDHPVWDVWASVKRAYPGGTINWDADPSPEWAYALDGLSRDQIATGLKTMIQEGGSFPPSAPSFRDMCGVSDWEHRAQSRSVHEALSAPTIDRSEQKLIESDVPDIPLFDFKALWQNT
jgi:hypothetical protein